MRIPKQAPKASRLGIGLRTSCPKGCRLYNQGMETNCCFPQASLLFRCGNFFAGIGHY